MARGPLGARAGSDDAPPGHAVTAARDGRRGHGTGGHRAGTGGRRGRGGPVDRRAGTKGRGPRAGTAGGRRAGTGDGRRVPRTRSLSLSKGRDHRAGRDARGGHGRPDGHLAGTDGGHHADTARGRPAGTGPGRRGLGTRSPSLSRVPGRPAGRAPGHRAGRDGPRTRVAAVRPGHGHRGHRRPAGDGRRSSASHGRRANPRSACRRDLLGRREERGRRGQSARGENPGERRQRDGECSWRPCPPAAGRRRAPASGQPSTASSVWLPGRAASRVSWACGARFSKGGRTERPAAPSENRPGVPTLSGLPRSADIGERGHRRLAACASPSLRRASSRRSTG